MSDVQVHEVHFEPARRGRTPLVSVEGLVNTAADNNGRWTSRVYEERFANSVIRQIKTKYDSNVVEVASLREGDGMRRVYVRVHADTEDPS